MKLIDLLDKAVDPDVIISNKEWKIGIRYCKQTLCFVFCDPISGEIIKNMTEISGFKKVPLSPRLLNLDSWTLKRLKIKLYPTDTYCPKCGAILYTSDIEGYKSVCLSCNKRNDINYIIDCTRDVDVDFDDSTKNTMLYLSKKRMNSSKK